MGAASKLTILNSIRGELSQAQTAAERLNALFDEGTFVELDTFASKDNQHVGVVTGYGCIEGSTVFAFAQDHTAQNGAVNRIHGAKIRKMYDLAVKTGAPVVGIYDSNGADLKEGGEVLAAYGEMLMWSNQLSGVVPQVSLVLGVCAGTAAMLATSADFVIMSENAEFFMTAPFTAAANGEVAEGFGTAAFAAKSGVAHIVEKSDADAIAQARKIISMFPLNNLSAAPYSEFSELNGTELLRSYCENLSSLDMDEAVKYIVDAYSMTELQKEFGTSALIGIATIAGMTCGIVATRRNVLNGKIDADACVKMARFVSICDAFQIPVVTFVDTNGFAPSVAAELAGSIRESAKLAHVYAEATCPKVAVVLGDAYSSAFVALASRNANADVTLAWPSASISALDPITAVSILYGDKISDEINRAQLAEQYRSTEASAYTAARDGYIEDIIDPANTRAAVISALDMLAGKRVAKLPKKHSNMPL